MTTTITRSATSKQVAFIVRLLAERDTAGTPLAALTPEVAATMGSVQASNAITALMALPRREAADPAAPLPEPVKPSREGVRQAIEAAFGPTWDSAVEQGLDSAADAVLALLPGRCAPTEEEIEQAILSARSPVSYEVVAGSAAVQVLALFAAQPTVREAKAEALREFAKEIEHEADEFPVGYDLTATIVRRAREIADRSEANHG